MCKYEMDPMSIVEDTERTRFCPHTDRRTDGQSNTSIPPFQLRWSGGYNDNDYNHNNDTNNDNNENDNDKTAQTPCQSLYKDRRI